MHRSQQPFTLQLQFDLELTPVKCIYTHSVRTNGRHSVTTDSAKRNWTKTAHNKLVPPSIYHDKLSFNLPTIRSRAFPVSATAWIQQNPSSLSSTVSETFLIQIPFCCEHFSGTGDSLDHLGQYNRTDWRSDLARKTKSFRWLHEAAVHTVGSRDNVRQSLRVVKSSRCKQRHGCQWEVLRYDNRLQVKRVTSVRRQTNT